MDKMCRKIEEKQSIFFREEFRNARTKAIEDAEGFQAILFTLEKLGAYLNPDGNSLHNYKICIEKLAENSDLLPSKQSFANLFDIVKDARNDALHQGAFARHLTQNAIRISLILEDALEKILERKRTLKVEDFMVSEVICANLWKPLAFIRQQMLANSFSYLPFFDESKEEWFLISDHQLAIYLRSENGKNKRKKKLSELLKDVCNKLEVEKAEVVSETDEISKILEFDGKPILVAKDKNAKSLFGIITPFDIL